MSNACLSHPENANAKFIGWAQILLIGAFNITFRNNSISIFGKAVSLVMLVGTCGICLGGAIFIPFMVTSYIAPEITAPYGGINAILTGCFCAVLFASIIWWDGARSYGPAMAIILSFGCTAIGLAAIFFGDQFVMRKQYAKLIAGVEVPMETLQSLSRISPVSIDGTAFEGNRSEGPFLVSLVQLGFYDQRSLVNSTLGMNDLYRYTRTNGTSGYFTAPIGFRFTITERLAELEAIKTQRQQDRAVFRDAESAYQKATISRQ